MSLELTQGDIAVLNKDHGVIFGRGAQVLTDAKKANLAMAMDAELVAGSLVTTPNGGFPALFTTWVDPNLIEILVSRKNGRGGAVRVPYSFQKATNGTGVPSGYLEFSSTPTFTCAPVDSGANFLR